MERRQATTTAEQAPEAEQSGTFTTEAETGSRRAKKKKKREKQTKTKNTKSNKRKL